MEDRILNDQYSYLREDDIEERKESGIDVMVNPATITIDILEDDTDVEATLTIEQASTLFDKLAKALELVGERNGAS